MENGEKLEDVPWLSGSRDGWVGGREGGRMGGVDSSYEGRVYDNLAEVEGGEKTHSPAFRDVIKDSTFRPASFSLPAFHKRQRTSVQLKET